MKRRLMTLLSLVVLLLPSPLLAVEETPLDSGDLEAIFRPSEFFDADSGSGGCFVQSFPTVTNEDNFAAALENYLKTAYPNSPYNTEVPELGKKLVQSGSDWGVNPMLVLAIGIQESGMGSNDAASAIRRGSHNAFGRKATSAQPHIVVARGNGQNTLWFKWDSWEDSINGPENIFKFLKEGYVDNPQTPTVEKIINRYLTGNPDGVVDDAGNTSSVYYDSAANTMTKIISQPNSGVNCSGDQQLVGITYPPNLGSAVGGGYFQMPQAINGEYIFNGGTPASQRCGSKQLIGLIYSVSLQWKNTYSDSVIMVGDLNAPGHASHENGIDWDLFTSNRSGGDTDGEQERSIRLGRWLVDSKIVKLVFYNDPVVQDAVNAYARSKGDNTFIMKYWPGHEDHFHVRIYDRFAGPASTGCS